MFGWNMERVKLPSVFFIVNLYLSYILIICSRGP